MPWSWDIADREVMEWIEATFEKEAPILDVGPGMGKWGKALKEKGFKVVDCLECWAPYVLEYNLHDIYRDVLVGDIRYFQRLGKYELLVLGDVFEHLTPEESKRFLKDCGRSVVLVVPWKLPQVIMEGNTQETHKQDDLTEEVMAERYPELVPLALGKLGGAYTFVPEEEEKNA